MSHGTRTTHDGRARAVAAAVAATAAEADWLRDAGLRFADGSLGAAREFPKTLAMS